MKTLSHLQNEAIERFEKAWVTSYGKIIYGETGFLTTDAGEPFRIEKDLVRDFLKTELTKIVKESFKNTGVEEKEMRCLECADSAECECRNNNFSYRLALSDKQEKENQFLNN